MFVWGLVSDPPADVEAGETNCVFDVNGEVHKLRHWFAGDGDNINILRDRNITNK